MRRAGGWVLGLLVVAAMGGGGWFALRNLLFAPTVDVVLMRTSGAHDPTMKALLRGATFALEEAGARAGKFRVRLIDAAPEQADHPSTAAWIGSSEAMNLKVNSAPVGFSVFEVIPWERGGYPITPGAVRMGALAAAWAKRKGGPRVALIRAHDSQSSHFLAKGFVDEAKQQGLDLVFDGTTEDPAIADRVLPTRPDLVFYTGEDAPYATTFKLFSALRKKGFAGPLATGDAHPEVSFLATRPSLVDGTFLISPFAPAPADLAARMGAVPGPHVTAGYYSMKMALRALERSNSIKQDDLMKGLSTLGSFGPAGGQPLRPGAIYVARNGIYEFVEELK
jgi:substrate-binding family protein